MLNIWAILLDNVKDVLLCLLREPVLLPSETTVAEVLCGLSVCGDVPVVLCEPSSGVL